MKANSDKTLVNGCQEFSAYTPEDLRVWGTLFDRQMKNLEKLASEQYLRGVGRVGFSPQEIPQFSRVNEILQQCTGWQVVAVEGIVDDRRFFELLSQKKFPATTWLRSPGQLEYLEEPDMFHDVFAHVPLLANPAFALFLEQISRIGLRYAGDEEAIELLSRVYWYTVEFGLIREKGQLKIYGAGILSSPGESSYAVSMEPMHFEYNIEQILNTPYRKDVFQDRYFIIDSFEKLYEGVHEIEEHVDAIMSKRQILTKGQVSEMRKNGQDLVPSW